MITILQLKTYKTEVKIKKIEAISQMNFIKTENNINVTQNIINSGDIKGSLFTDSLQKNISGQYLL